MPLNSALKNTMPVEATAHWLQDFETAARSNDAKAVRQLFLGDSHWRDLLAFTWNIETHSGADAIEALLKRTLATTKPHNLRIAPDRTPPQVVSRAGEDCIEAIIGFQTSAGPCSGVVRLMLDTDGRLRCWVLMTDLNDITNHEQQLGQRRPTGKEYSGGFGKKNWLDHRNKQWAYENHDPVVIVVGGSQSGLGIAACLGRFGVDTLVIDRHERVGDAWRKRYHNLVLHNEVFVNHLPYMKFPENWPVYIPKDKLANWFEAYADAMELNIWGGTEIKSGAYDEATDQWTVVMSRSDGTERILKPRHVVFATGVSSIPIRPKLPGLDSFHGKVMHSGDYQNGHAWKDKNAIVIGTGNSGHDVAHDLHASGVHTAIVQRNSTLIVSLKEAQRVYQLYQSDTPVEDCDLIASATPYPVLVQGYQITAAKNQEQDKALLDSLRARGFKLDNGPPDNTGFQMKYLRRGGGYYFNVGCSDLIANGSIKLLQNSDIETFVANGAKMKDGSTIEADLIVTATGYRNQQDVARLFMGDAVADRIGVVWGFGEDGEQRNMWRRTPQPGLWFTGGGLPHVRIYSKYLAMQIKAIEQGIIAKDMPGADDAAGKTIDNADNKQFENA